MLYRAFRIETVYLSKLVRLKGQVELWKVGMKMNQSECRHWSSLLFIANVLESNHKENVMLYKRHMHIATSILA